MPLISVLTITHPAGAGFLHETIQSVEAQQLPPGWDLEWIVQEDGPPSELREHFAGREWIKYSANGLKLGIGPTRNLALSRASGSLVQNLDSDDLLLPDGLSALIPAFDDPSLHWAVGQADDLLADGVRKSFPSYIPLGHVAAGAANTWALEHGGNWPIHCAGLMMRASSLRAVGGWGGAIFDDDIIMFAALSEMTDGWADESTTWLYRQHPGQVTRDPLLAPWGESGRTIALQRALAIRATGMTLPQSSGEDIGSVVVRPPMKGSPGIAHVE